MIWLIIAGGCILVLALCNIRRAQATFKEIVEEE